MTLMDAGVELTSLDLYAACKGFLKYLGSYTGLEKMVRLVYWDPPADTDELARVLWEVDSHMPICYRF